MGSLDYNLTTKRLRIEGYSEAPDDVRRFAARLLELADIMASPLDASLGKTSTDSSDAEPAKD